MSPQEGSCQTYESASTFVKVTLKKLWLCFFLDTVYLCQLWWNSRASPKLCLLLSGGGHIFLSKKITRF